MIKIFVLLLRWKKSMITHKISINKSINQSSQRWERRSLLIMHWRVNPRAFSLGLFPLNACIDKLISGGGLASRCAPTTPTHKPSQRRRCLTLADGATATLEQNCCIVLPFLIEIVAALIWLLYWLVFIIGGRRSINDYWILAIHILLLQSLLLFHFACFFKVRGWGGLARGVLDWLPDWGLLGLDWALAGPWVLDMVRQIGKIGNCRSNRFRLFSATIVAEFLPARRLVLAGHPDPNWALVWDEGLTFNRCVVIGYVHTQRD